MSVIKLFVFIQIFTITLFSRSVHCNYSSFTDLFRDIFGRNVNIQDGMEEIQMIIYERSSELEELSHSYPLARSQEILKHVDANKPYVLYIHGYLEVPSNESVQTVVSAYLERGSDNIAVLDWSAFAFGNYINVAVQANDIAEHTGKALGYLAAAGLNTDTLHVIGHSLGAQIAGFLARHVNFTIPRVTGLDPANPLFYQFGAHHINKTSGLQVDVIHTDGGSYGALTSTGSIDFFANGGRKLQPGCLPCGQPLSPRNLCSHWRSWRFYAESITNNTAFPALKCSSYKKFLYGECNSNDIVYFGYALPENATGKYYFTTNRAFPYGKGLLGINKGQTN